MCRRKLVEVAPGRVVRVYGAFSVRVQVARFSDDTNEELAQYAITLVDPNAGDGETPEEKITLLHGREIGVARVVRRLYDWLRESEELSRQLTRAQVDVPSPGDSDELRERPWLEHVPEGLDRARRKRERVVRALQSLETEYPDLARRDVDDTSAPGNAEDTVT